MKNEKLEPVELGEVKMEMVTGETVNAEPEVKKTTKKSAGTKSKGKTAKSEENSKESSIENSKEELTEVIEQVKENLMVYPLVKSAKVPMFATEESACFDLRLCLEGTDEIIGYDDFNKEIKTAVRRNSPEAHVILRPGTRVKLPTQLMFDLKENQKLVLYSRSGSAFKEGIVLINAPAIIDSDYSSVDQVWLLVKNISSTRIVIKDGQRICQAELQSAYNKGSLSIRRAGSRPVAKAEGNGTQKRNGGVGSTGNE